MRAFVTAELLSPESVSRADMAVRSSPIPETSNGCSYAASQKNPRAAFESLSTLINRRAMHDKVNSLRHACCIFVSHCFISGMCKSRHVSWTERSRSRPYSAISYSIVKGILPYRNGSTSINPYHRPISSGFFRHSLDLRCT